MQRVLFFGALIGTVAGVSLQYGTCDEKMGLAACKDYAENEGFGFGESEITCFFRYTLNADLCDDRDMFPDTRQCRFAEFDNGPAVEFAEYDDTEDHTTNTQSVCMTESLRTCDAFSLSESDTSISLHSVPFPYKIIKVGSTEINSDIIGQSGYSPLPSLVPSDGHSLSYFIDFEIINVGDNIVLNCQVVANTINGDTDMRIVPSIAAAACDEGLNADACMCQTALCTSDTGLNCADGTCTACANGKYQDQDDAASASCKFCAAGKTSNGKVCAGCDGYNLDPRDGCKPMSELPVDYQNHQCCQNCGSGTVDDCDFTEGSVHDKCGCMSYQAIGV